MVDCSRISSVFEDVCWVLCKLQVPLSSALVVKASMNRIAQMQNGWQSGFEME